MSVKSVILIIGITLAFANLAYSCKCTKPKPGEEVCGSDGETYQNNCHLTCISMDKYEINQCLTKVSDGVCGSSPCICNEPCKYVCGSNGQTYGNDCTLDCVKKQNPTLTKAKDGMCTS